MMQGHYEEASRAASEALRLFERIIGQKPPKMISGLMRRTLSGDPINVGRAHWLLGLIASITGKQRVSVQHFHEALAVFEHAAAHRYIAIVNNDLGCLYVSTSQYDLARSAIQRSLDLAGQMG